MVGEMREWYSEQERARKKLPQVSRGFSRKQLGTDKLRAFKGKAAERRHPRQIFRRFCFPPSSS
eukprot:9231849-Alexandrium_andersonii.AAC.1